MLSSVVPSCALGITVSSLHLLAAKHLSTFASTPTAASRLEEKHANDGSHSGSLGLSGFHNAALVESNMQEDGPVKQPPLPFGRLISNSWGKFLAGSDTVNSPSRHRTPPALHYPRDRVSIELTDALAF